MHASRANPVSAWGHADVPYVCSLFASWLNELRPLIDVSLSILPLNIHKEIQFTNYIPNYHTFCTNK